MRTKWLDTLLLFSLVLVNATHSFPVRAVGDEKNDDHSPGLPEKEGKATSTHSASEKSTKTEPKPQSWEEKREKDRKRKRLKFQQDPEHMKAIYRKAYLKRKADPAKVAHDAEKRTKYKDANRDRINENQREYYYRKLGEEQQKKYKPRVAHHTGPRSTSQRGKERKYDDLGSTSKQSERTSVSQTSKDSHQHIIARLKLPRKTIEKFYDSRFSKN